MEPMQPAVPPRAVEARRINQLIADGYDAIFYDPPANPGLDPEHVFGLANLYGCARTIGRKFDALDLGCGAGRQLERIGAGNRGLLVGLDISARNCAAASQRLARFGARAQVMCKDILDVDGRHLGEFDLLILVGVLSVAPSAVQHALLDAVGHCLTPGGVAVLGYYAGAMPKLRAEIHARLRAVVDPADPASVQVRAARAALMAMPNEFPPNSDERHCMETALRQTAAQSDTVFFHEVLNFEFYGLNTSLIEAELAPRGVEFLNYLPACDFGGLETSRDRAVAADALDAKMGGYRYAVFGNVGEGSSAPPPRAPQIRWSSRLVYSGFGARYRGAANYRDPVNGMSTSVNRVETQAALDELGGGARNFAQLLGGARNRLSKAGLKADAGMASMICEDLLHLTWAGFVAPLWKEA